MIFSTREAFTLMPTKLSRRVSASLLLTLLLCAVGCSTQEKVVYDPVNTRPIVGDDAMALRSDWPKSASYYQNGDVADYSTRYPFQAKEVKTDTGHLFLDTVTFLGETAFLPIEFIANPPFQPQVSYGVKYPPTYTAQPPLPPPGGTAPLREYLYSGPAAQVGASKPY
jgi:hypothetical protein